MTETLQVPRWLHRWSVGTVCAAAVMLTLGAVVTTFRVGMADQVWPTYPWHLLLIDLDPAQAGFLIEHSHRAMGHILGLSVIVLAVGLWSYEPHRGLRVLGLLSLLAMIVSLAAGFALKTTGRTELEGLEFRAESPILFWWNTIGPWLICLLVMALVLGVWGIRAIGKREGAFWLRWLGTAALVGVMLQGLLGGFRVQFHALFGTDLAALHGTFAQIVFALLVTLALLTSPGWALFGEATLVEAATRVRRLSLMLVGFVAAQLVLGAVVRHTSSPLAQRAHLLNAFAVLSHAVLLADPTRRLPSSGRTIRRAYLFLLGLLILQLVLGIEAWVGKFGLGGRGDFQTPTAYQAVIRTAHVLVGSWILATSVVIALRAWRLAVPRVHYPTAPVHRLEGAA